ncbi:MAG TPA: hypothetical protein VIL30_26425, partial [Ramlibacter sp.]
MSLSPTAAVASAFPSYPVLPVPVAPLEGALPPAARQHSAVATWKRQLAGFAAAVTTLLVAVALGSAGAMWHLISEVARAEAIDEPRSRAAVATRIAVVEVERLLAETIAQEDPTQVRAAAVASIAAAS